MPWVKMINRSDQTVFDQLEDPVPDPVIRYPVMTYQPSVSGGLFIKIIPALPVKEHDVVPPLQNLCGFRHFLSSVAVGDDCSKTFAPRILLRLECLSEHHRLRDKYR